MPPQRQWVLIRAGANRAGHPIHAQVIAFVRRLAIAEGHPLTIICGTNHNRYVKGTTRQSQHWTGDAADIGPFHGTGPSHIDPHLTELGRRALLLCGASRSWALKTTGGAWTLRGVNILFNTYIGGDHYNHLHVGLLSLPLGLGSGHITIPGTTEPGSQPAPEQPPPVHLPARVRVQKDWHSLMNALDPELHAKAADMRSLGRTIVSRVK